jgi:hypothetical protein
MPRLLINMNEYRRYNTYLNDQSTEPAKKMSHIASMRGTRETHLDKGDEYRQCLSHARMYWPFLMAHLLISFP